MYCKVTNTTEFGSTPEWISAYLKTLWLNRWKSPLTDVASKISFTRNPLLVNPAHLLEEFPILKTATAAYLRMANTTIFNEINWNFSKCASPMCLSGYKDNAYHYFFVCSKISAFRPNKIVLFDIFDDTDCKILKKFISSSRKLEELYS